MKYIGSLHGGLIPSEPVISPQLLADGKGKSVRVLRSLSANLLYGSDLRLLVCLRWWLHFIEFDMQKIMVRNGKGTKDRVTVLPDPVTEPLKRQVAQVRIIHEGDTSEGFGEVYLPFALLRGRRAVLVTFCCVSGGALVCITFTMASLRSDPIRAEYLAQS
jgi:hypothetical protein